MVTYDENLLQEQQEKMNGIYTKIGERYYTAHKNDGGAEFAELFDAVRACEKRMADHKAEVLLANGLMLCPRCGEEIYYKSNFCNFCGIRVVDPAPAPAEPTAGTDDSDGEEADSEDPLAEPSVEEPAVEEMPAEELPAEEVIDGEPLEEEPLEEEPIEEEPLEDDSLEDEPLEDEPLEDESVEEEPVGEEPPEEEPVGEEPFEDEPVGEDPLEEELLEEEPLEEELFVEEAPVGALPTTKVFTPVPREEQEPFAGYEATEEETAFTADPAGGETQYGGKLICGVCGAELDDDCRFCVECGAPVDSAPREAENEDTVRFCVECGYKVLDPEAIFCNSCGSRLDGASPQGFYRQAPPRDKVCPFCGFRTADPEVVFCIECGTKLN